MMRRLLPLLLFLAAACASTPKNPYRPEVTLDQLNALNLTATTRAPITVAVQVRNTSIQPMTLRLVRIEGAFTQQYTIAPVEQALDQAVQPGESHSVRLLLTAVSQQGYIDDPEPLNLRGFVTYTVGEQQYQDLYVFRPMIQ